MATSKKNKKTLNIAMAVIAAVIVIVGIGIAAGFRGAGPMSALFSSQQPAVSQQAASSGTAPSAAQDNAGPAPLTFTVKDTRGNVDLERNGLSMSLDKGAALQDGDVLSTRNGSQITIGAGAKSTLVLDENAKLSVAASSLALDEGELFGIVKTASGETPLTTTTELGVAQQQKGVFTMTAHKGASMVMQLGGKATYGKAAKTLNAGTSVDWARSPKDDTKMNVTTRSIALASLSPFALKQARAALKAKNKLFFKAADLDELEKSRDAEKTAQASGASGSKANSSTSTSTSTSTSGSSKSGSSKSGSAKSGSDSSGKSDKSAKSGKPDASAKAKQYSATIEIVCSTILDNKANLAAGKDKYVPDDGVIIAKKTVTFTDGESVFDVLKRACSDAGVQLEYNYTPGYGSYYVEGINNLYEFDCGPESGWMYKVNGWFPNYGCSEYKVKEGDAIVWCYTCNGLGKDVGASVG